MTELLIDNLTDFYEECRFRIMTSMLLERAFPSDVLLKID